VCGPLVSREMSTQGTALKTDCPCSWIWGMLGGTLAMHPWTRPCANRGSAPRGCSTATISLEGQSINADADRHGTYQRISVGTYRLAAVPSVHVRGVRGGVRMLAQVWVSTVRVHAGGVYCDANPHG
jgi:hypothetical protein